MANFALAAAAALLASATAEANTLSKFGVTSKLQIYIPKNLTRSGGYDHREATFGIPPYGGSLQQSLYYADSDLCGPGDTSKGYPKREKKANSNEMEPWPTPYILMVDRGGCTFVTKVRNAQRTGAAGVIVADHQCVCSEVSAGNCTSDLGVDCEQNEPTMADDGSGSDISVPSFLITKQDADLIKAVVRGNQMVRVEMSWALPRPDNRVEYDLWTTPATLLGNNFLKAFKEVAVSLGSHAYFTPHMYIYNGITSGCQGPDGENQCYSLCTNNGRYCATDPDNDLDRGISGADVVGESLRRTCIWKHYGEYDGIGVQWWDYVNEFMARCGNEDFFKNEDCIKDAMAHSGVDYGKISDCISNSGGLDSDSKNSILEDQLAAKNDAGVVMLPSAFVNGAAVRGAFSYSVIFKAICAGYLEGTEPDICKECANCPDERACVQQGKCDAFPHYNGAGNASGGGGVSVRTFNVTLILVIGVLAGVGFMYWKKTRDEMRNEVRDILAQYMLLEDGERDGESAAAPTQHN